MDENTVQRSENSFLVARMALVESNKIRRQLIDYGRFIGAAQICPGTKPDCPKTNCLFAGTGERQCWATFQV